MERPTRETLTVEFKSDRRPLPLDELYKALVAMANTDGGVLYLGVEDNGHVSGVSEQHKNLIEMAAKVQTHTVPSLVLTLRLETWDQRDVLALEVNQSRQLTMTSDGQYLRRRLKPDGSPENIPMQPHEIMQRLSSIRAIDPSAQVIETIAAREALNPLERERLRGMVRTYRGEAPLLELSDEELDKALDLVRELDGVCYPTVAGLLLMGHERYIREFVPGNEVLFQMLDGVNVLVNPPAMRESLLQIFEKVSLLFQSRVVEQEIQVGLFRVPVPNYEREAFREGLCQRLGSPGLFCLRRGAGSAAKSGDGHLKSGGVSGGGQRGQHSVRGTDSEEQDSGGGREADWSCGANGPRSGQDLQRHASQWTRNPRLFRQQRGQRNPAAEQRLT